MRCTAWGLALVLSAQAGVAEDCTRWRYAMVDKAGTPRDGLDLILERVTSGLVARTPGFPRQIDGPDPVWIANGQWLAGLALDGEVLGHLAQFNRVGNFRKDHTVWFDASGVQFSEGGFDMIFLSRKGSAWLQDDWVTLMDTPDAAPPDEVLLSLDTYRFLDRPIYNRWFDTLTQDEAIARTDRLQDLLHASTGTWIKTGCAP
ncbi:hypothetical protein [Stagnihabitans tardus]|uniref:Uncharacterized protein n=1 Tax=Stagnihabitans tardus TaxID=2699202 RepID=A0AAE5BU66_9RHOB|nr:hypothetical protein [Stagnihabitans tardus]NBZ87501.1 hypothetical protein [Stagnihabitans tardus]